MDDRKRHAICPYGSAAAYIQFRPLVPEDARAGQRHDLARIRNFGAVDASVGTADLFLRCATGLDLRSLSRRLDGPDYFAGAVSVVLGAAVRCRDAVPGILLLPSGDAVW